MLVAYAEGQEYALKLPFPTTVEEVTDQFVSPYPPLSAEELAYMAAVSAIMLGRMSAHLFNDNPITPIEPSRN